MSEVIREAYQARQKHRMQKWKVCLLSQKTDSTVKKP